MAITSSAKKAIRASAKKRIFNLRRKQEIDRVFKDIQKAVKLGKTSDAQKLLPAAYRALDKAMKTKYIKKNAAARLKSRVTRLVNKSSAKK